MSAYMYAFCAKETQVVLLLLQFMAQYMTPILLQFIGTTSARCAAETRWLTLFESCTYSDVLVLAGECPFWLSRTPALTSYPSFHLTSRHCRCSGIDPAALQVTNFFAFYPVAAIAATTGLPAPWAALLKVRSTIPFQFLSGCCSGFVCLALVAPA